MKIFLTIIIVCFSLCRISLTSAQQDSPIEISPLIGTTLDRVERNYFHLFPTVDGFENAVFYLNADNSLRVEITIDRNEVLKDTVIPKYSSLEEIEKHIISRVFMDLYDDAGPNFTIQTSFSRLSAQKIVTLDQQRLFTVDQLTIEQKIKEPSLNLIWETYLNEINSVVKEGRSNFWNYSKFGAIFGSLAGTITGLIIGTKKTNHDGETASFEGFYILYGALIGAGVGFITGAILGISSSEEKIVIYPDTPEGLSTLQSYSLYYRKGKQKTSGG